MLEMGIESWRSGLVGATADCKIATFDVPIGSGVHVPSRKGDADSENGTVPLADSLHIHTAKCTPIGAGDDLSEPRVTPKTWDVDQQELKASDGVPVLLMHGYGSGIAIYSAMLPGMAAQYGGAVYAIDTLGCGLSSRPAADGHWTDLTVRQSEDFFVAGIERWRQAMGFDKVNLVGHSIGGYLAVTYAERCVPRSMGTRESRALLPAL
jgi:pimeloyl-ACP methyl ester carboxylesterase